MNAPTRPTAESLVAAAGGSIHDFRKATRKMRWWYESLADYMIANPSASQTDIAAYFSRNPATISTVVNTDAFKAYFRQRRAQHAEGLDTAVRAKLFNLANASLDHMLAALEKKRDSVPLETLQRTSDMALKNLGYGAGSAPGVTVNVDQKGPQTVNVAVSLDDLTRAREALRRNQLKVIDNESPAFSGSGTTPSAGLAGGGTTPSPASSAGAGPKDRNDKPPDDPPEAAA